jgi:5-methylcytosine-specific restriction protein A
MSDRWSSSDRRAELPDDWSSRVRATRRRARGQCEWRLPSKARCPRPGTDCDHKGKPDDHRLSNLQWLCPTHHKVKTAGEAAAARAALKPRPSSRPDPHPGIIPHSQPTR